MSVRYDHVGGVWTKVKKRYDKINGIWIPTKTRFDKTGGAWSKSFVGADCQVKNLNPSYGGFNSDGSFKFQAPNGTQAAMAQITFNDPITFPATGICGRIENVQAGAYTYMSVYLSTTSDISNTNAEICGGTFSGYSSRDLNSYREITVTSVYLNIVSNADTGFISWPAAALTICDRNIKTVDLIS